MSTDDFKKTLSDVSPHGNWSPYLLSLWYDGKKDWERAHTLIQDIEDRHAAWIHAYLHRAEGDTWNADYWYNRAGKKRPALSLQQEWEELVEYFLGQTG